MKRLIFTLLLCASVASAENATVASQTAFFFTRNNVLPEKVATQGAFQCLFGCITFVPAALAAVAVKRYTTASNAPNLKDAIGEASWALALSTVAGSIFGGVSVFLWSQGVANFAEAAASEIWNPPAVPVKTPFSVRP